MFFTKTSMVGEFDTSFDACLGRALACNIFSVLDKRDDDMIMSRLKILNVIVRQNV